MHRAVAACDVGGVVAIDAGLFRWNGVIKVRKGRVLHSNATSHAARKSSGAPSTVSCQDVEPLRGESARGGGIHIRGVEGTVLMGQWLLGRQSSGSLVGVGLAGNVSALYDVVLDVRAGPWRLEKVECRCVGGGLVRVCEWGELDCGMCVFAGMDAVASLRAASGVLAMGYANLRCSPSAKQNLTTTRQFCMGKQADKRGKTQSN